MMEKTLLVVKAYYNDELGKPEYGWEFPDQCNLTRMLGILDMIKYELLKSIDQFDEEEK